MRIKNIIISLKMPKKYDFLLHFVVLILIAFGTLMIVSTNVGNTNKDSLILLKVIAKQVVFVCVSYFLMTFFANNFSMKKARKMLPIVALIIFGLLLYTLSFGAVLGSRAWIHIYIWTMEITIQPSEFAKVFMIVVMAVYIRAVGKRNWDFWKIVFVPVILLLLYCGVILFEKDLGTFFVLIVLCAICFLIPSHKNLRRGQQVVKICFVAGACLLLFVISDQGFKMIEEMPFIGHVGVRIENAINPFLEPHGDGYQLINGIYGIARSNFTGVGLGNSIQKYGFLTQSDNDFILSIIIEELGIFGLLVVIVGYFLIIQRLFYYAFHTMKEYYKIILIGTAMYLFVHFVLNVGGISGLIPLTGVPLLFMSSGGSSLMSIMSAIGISQAVISQIRHPKDAEKQKKESQGVGTL